MTDRRQFLKLAALAGSSLAFPFVLRSSADSKSPVSKKLDIALIGTGGRGVNTCRDMAQLSEYVNVIAVCDVDPGRGGSGAKHIKARWPGVRSYQDYRKLFDTEKNIRAVIVTTPDHMHAPISMLAMSRGLHVFCEKPLTRTIHEARRMRQIAADGKVVTQMGAQSSINLFLRRSIEVIQSGLIGDVTDVVVWCDRKPVVPASGIKSEMPANMDWQTWLGVSPDEPFDSRYHPSRWRWWTQYGTGPLGDMGCHLTNLAFRALDLRTPEKIDVVKLGRPPAPGMFPKGSHLVYHFPEYNKRKALKLTWYDGGWTPPRELFARHGLESKYAEIKGSEKMIIGTKGLVYGDSYLKLHGEEKLLGVMNHPAAKDIPQRLPRARRQGTDGHYLEWIQACLANAPAAPFASFETASRQTEMVLLGTIAQRLGKSIRWDSEKMEVPGEPAAAAMITPAYRPGYTI